MGRAIFEHVDDIIKKLQNKDCIPNWLYPNSSKYTEELKYWKTDELFWSFCSLIT